MKKRLFPVALVAFAAWLAACSPLQPISKTADVRPTKSPTPVSATGFALPPSPQPTYTPTGQPPAAAEPGIPATVDELRLGVPAGNGNEPYLVAVDSQRRRLYTLNYGTSALKEGNTISVLNLETNEIVALLDLGNMPQQSPLSPTPLDLQIDPYRPRLYALWGDRYADATDSTLTIVDLETQAIVDTLPGVEAIAPGPDRLYLADDTRLWTVDPDSLTELDARHLDRRWFNEPLLLDPQANRLYLGRGRPWSLEVFEADSLISVGSYPIADKLIGAVADANSEHLFILASDGEQVTLRALDAEGRPLADPAPISLTDDLYSDLPLTFDGQTLYVAEGNSESYRLHAFALPDLTSLGSLAIPYKPNDLAVDPTTGFLYAVYSSPSSYVLAIDPEAGPAETVYTALRITDAVADPTTGRLYVLDESGTLRVLNLADHREIARTETGFDILNGYHVGYGRLSLDPGRNRLYIGGDPVRIVDTDSLAVTALEMRGQVTPDPIGHRVYLTPPCACRVEQCNTLILNADTLTGTETLFPPEDPFTAPCVIATSLDAENRLLYARIYNGVPGSNSGDYFSVFDISGRPKELYTDFQISYGNVAFDPLRRRAFLPRYRIDRSFIHRFELQGGTITQTLELVGAQGQLAYDPPHDRLYAVGHDGALQVFDGDLTLLAEITLPGEFDLLTFDLQGQRLYLKGPGGDRIWVVATGGGQLEPPPPVISPSDQPQTQQFLVAPGGDLFRVYDQRLYRSDDGGQTWELLGRGLPGRPVGAVAISPDYEKDRTLLAGLWNYGRGGGLYRSTDGGDTWLPTTRGLTDMEISEIVFSPTYARDRTVFLTTFDHGLFRSTDGGDTWLSLADRYAADPYDSEVNHLALSPTFADDHLIIISRGHLLRSTDGGDTWQDTGIPGGLVAFSPSYADDHLILSSGRWRSTDGGQTWQPSAVGLGPARSGAQHLFFSPDFADDQTVYISLRQNYDAPLTLQRSVDAGRSWESLLGGLPAGFEIVSATILPPGELYLTALDGRTLTTLPEALTWGKQTLDVTQLELQDLAVAPDGAIFVANSGAGVFKSVDGGRTWTETNFPARSDPMFQPGRLAIADEGTLFAAAGIVMARSTDGGEHWTPLPGLPAGFEIASLAVSPGFAASRVVLAGENYGSSQIVRSSDGGETWEVVFDGASVEDAAGVSAITFSPNFATDGTAYAWLRGGGLLRSADGGRSWSLIESEQSGYYGQSLAVSPAGDLYLGALGGHVLVSEDEGRHWRDLEENIPDERDWSTALAFTPDGALFLGTDKGVYRTLDGGQTWTRASAGLPLRPDEETPQAARALYFDNGRLYAAMTHDGLFVSTDLGETWRSTVTGQPASPLPTPAPTTPTPVPTQTPTPQLPLLPADCPSPPDDFADLWVERIAQLGCPVASQSVPMVEQTFEGGWMFWRSDAADIYVIPSVRPYARFDDTWDSSQPTYSCPDLFPSQTPPTPQRGFGKVWCREPLVRKLLGNATSEERLFDAVVQEFDTGLIFRTDEGVTYILESRSNGWERIP